MTQCEEVTFVNEMFITIILHKNTDYGLYFTHVRSAQFLLTKN